MGIKTGLTRLKQELNNFQNNSSKDDTHKDYFTNEKEKHDGKKCVYKFRRSKRLSY